MSREVQEAAARLLPKRVVAGSLGVSTRHVDRLVERGVLAPPERQAGRKLWAEDAVERARLARLEQRPSNRRHVRTHVGTLAARRLRHDRAVVARVLLKLLDGESGRQIAIDILRRCAPRGLRGLEVDGLARLVAELEGAVRLVRALP